MRRNRRGRALSAWSGLAGPALVLALGCSLTFGLAAGRQGDIRAQTSRRLAGAARDTTGEVVGVITDYAAALDAAGVYYAQHLPDQAELAAYGETLELKDRLPGFRGITVLTAVTDAGRATFEATERARVGASFTITPGGTRADYFVVTGNSPGPLSSLGLDLGVGAARREAFERARDAGTPALTAPFTLVADEALPPSARKPAFALYVPIFRSGAPVGTIEQRRAALLGFAATTFHASDLLATVHRSHGTPVGFELYDGEPTAGSLAARVPDEATRGQTRLERLDLFGDHWTLRFWKLAGFPAPPALEVAAIAAVGSLLSLALAVVAGLLLRDRRRLARRVAEAAEEIGALEVRFEESEAMSRGAFDTTSVGMAVTDLEGRYLRVNGPMTVITGRTAAELAETSFLAITHPDDVDRTLAAALRGLAGDRSGYPLIKRFLRPD
ncbi:MAG TPA: CHASE domain-containing protein, partial [Acidimicrobiia bacterium]|nr:CHASE domain-containing protein [Acidimicrobiia bacterium]